MVKEAEYFKDSGGLDGSWGKHWIPVVADGLDHARLLAWFIGSGTQHPRTCAFEPPNSRTVGELM